MVEYPKEVFNGKTIVITGGAGFIGSNLAKYLQDCHARVIVFDKFRNTSFESKQYSLSLGHFKNLIGFRGEILAGDITSPKDLEMLVSYNIDYIFHQAAISDTTCMDEEKVIRTNTNAFVNILKLAIQCKAKVVYASSAGVYGNSPAPNCVGEGECPENVYGFSKLAMDRVAMQFARQYDLKVVGLRYFNVYGQGEYYKGKTASMVLQLGLQALANQEVKLFKDGEQKRDFVYIEDVVQANLKAAICDENGVYNVGYGKARSFNEIITLLKQHLNLDFKVHYIDNPYRFFQEHTCASIQDSQMKMGYSPQYSLEEGIKAYIPFIREIFQEYVSL